MFELKKALRFLIGFSRAKRGHKLSKPALVQLQSKQFKKLKNTVLGASKFYKDFLECDLQDFPIVNKKLYMENFNEINTKGLDRDEALDIAIRSEQSRDFKPLYRGYSVGLSSGTSGNRGLFVVSDLERSEWAGYIIGKLLPMRFGCHRIAFFLRANNNLYETVNSILVKFRFYDLLQPLGKKIDSIKEFSPTIIIGPGSVLKKVARAAPNLRPQKVICVAEVLEPEDRETLRQVFKVNADQVYQCTEGFLASTCKLGNLHLNEDIAIIEKHWIDKESGRFSPIITDLRRSTQPIVRYLLDDILIEDRKPCTCGSFMTRIKRIEGRQDDILILKNAEGRPIDVYPDFIRNSIISACKDLHEYAVIQCSPNLLEIQLTPLTRNLCSQIKEGLLKLWKTLEVVEPQYRFSDHPGHDAGKKRRRVKRQCDV